MKSTITITGMKETITKLKELERMDFLGAAVLAGAEHLKGVLDDYPPATIANSPAANRWYERGYGPRWRRKDGSIGGKKTSEFLGRKWTARKISNTASEVGTNVSYARYVLDQEKQARFHAAHGWKTIQQVAEEEQEFIINAIMKAIKKALEE